MQSSGSKCGDKKLSKKVMDVCLDGNEALKTSVNTASFAFLYGIYSLVGFPNNLQNYAIYSTTDLDLVCNKNTILQRKQRNRV